MALSNCERGIVLLNVSTEVSKPCYEANANALIDQPQRPTSLHSYIPVMPTPTPTHTHTHTHTPSHSHTRKHTHTRTDTYLHRHTQTDTHMHTPYQSYRLRAVAYLIMHTYMH